MVSKRNIQLRFAPQSTLFKFFFPVLNSDYRFGHTPTASKFKYEPSSVKMVYIMQDSSFCGGGDGGTIGFVSWWEPEDDFLIFWLATNLSNPKFGKLTERCSAYSGVVPICTKMEGISGMTLKVVPFRSSYNPNTKFCRKKIKKKKRKKVNSQRIK